MPTWTAKLKDHGKKAARQAKPKRPRPPVQEVIVTVRQSIENDPGEAAIGYFIVEDGAVTLTDDKGKPLGESVAHGEQDPRAIAGVLTRNRWSKARGEDFGRRLEYPKSGWL